MSRLSRFALVSALLSASLCGNAFGHNDHFGGVNSNFTEVPEPSTWALMASGLCTLVAAVRRRRR